MARSIVFLPAARLELVEAKNWYDREASGFGEHFVDAVDQQIIRITDNPLQFPLVINDVRRARLRRFPYGLYFRVVGQDVYVVACFHGSRDPMIWRGRI